jgi:hypothetical protein
LESIPAVSVTETNLGSKADDVGSGWAWDIERKSDWGVPLVEADFGRLTSSGEVVFTFRLVPESDMRGLCLIDLGAKAGSVDLLYVASVKPGIEGSEGVAL